MMLSADGGVGVQPTLANNKTIETHRNRSARILDTFAPTDEVSLILHGVVSNEGRCL
jgi:hypothetical protein